MNTDSMNRSELRREFSLLWESKTIITSVQIFESAIHGTWIPKSIAMEIIEAVAGKHLDYSSREAWAIALRLSIAYQERNKEKPCSDSNSKNNSKNNSINQKATINEPEVAHTKASDLKRGDFIEYVGMDNLICSPTMRRVSYEATVLEVRQIQISCCCCSQAMNMTFIRTSGAYLLFHSWRRVKLIGSRPIDTRNFQTGYIPDTFEGVSIS